MMQICPNRDNQRYPLWNPFLPQIPQLRTSHSQTDARYQERPARNGLPASNRTKKQQILDFFLSLRWQMVSNYKIENTLYHVIIWKIFITGINTYYYHITTYNGINLTGIFFPSFMFCWFKLIMSTLR